MKEDFAQAGVTQFGSGWCWLAVKDGKITVTKTPNGENPLVHGGKPILGCDVWEHSYYIDYRNRRPDYLKAFLDHLVNWDHVDEMYDAATQVTLGRETRPKGMPSRARSYARTAAFSTDGSQLGSLADRIAIAVLASVARRRRSTFRDYGLGWDDYTHSQYGDLLLALYGSGFHDTRALSFVNLYIYGGGFDMAAALAAKVLPFGLFETRRLIGAAVGILGLFVDLAHRPPRSAARSPAWSRWCCSRPARSITATCS